jgi:steroid 5-alpha reductase family enzyme
MSDAPHALLITMRDNASVIVACMFALWLVSLALKNASIVDVAWGLGFTVVAWVTWWTSLRDAHATWLAGMVTLWGVRLALHIGTRNAGKPEDARYQALRAKYAPFWWKSFWIVFMLQAALLLVVSLPVQAGMHAQPLVTVPHVVGVALFAFGFVVESTADVQMRLWKRPGEVLDRGLWRWSRHPNYFGELVLWWGIALFAFDASAHVVTWIACALGPATISFLLLRVSGLPMLEAQMRARPGWSEYAERTPSFWPRPPR